MAHFAPHSYAHATPAYEHNYAHAAPLHHEQMPQAHHGYETARAEHGMHDVVHESVAYDHSHVDQHADYSHVVTPITQMLDSATDNITWAMAYLHQHPIPDHASMNQYLEDSVETLAHFKQLHQHGRLTVHYLEQVRSELISVQHQLAHGDSVTEDRLAEYVESALHEIYVAQYLEMHGSWPDGVPIYNEHGEFTSDLSHVDTAHATAAHDYSTHGHRGYMANGVEEAAKADKPIEVATNDGITINIKGPVIISGEQDIASLLAQAMNRPVELSPLEKAQIMSLQSAPQPQQSQWRQQAYSGAGQASKWASQAQQMPSWVPYSSQIKQGAGYAGAAAQGAQGIAGMMGGGQGGDFNQYAGQAIGAAQSIGGMLPAKYGGYVQQGAKYAQQGLDMYNQAKPWLAPMKGAAQSAWGAAKGWWNGRKR